METTERTFKSIGLLAETCRLQEHPVNAGSANYVLGNIQRNIEQRALDLAAALAASAELEKKLQAAEQRASDIETNTAAKLAEFAKLVDIIDAEAKRLGIEWHGSASTMLKAVIQAAKAAAVEDPTIKQDLTVGAGKPVIEGCVLHGQALYFENREYAEIAAAVLRDRDRLWRQPLPPPVSEQEGERAGLVSCEYKFGLVDAANDLIGVNTDVWMRTPVDALRSLVQRTIYACHDKSTADAATIREQATEIERLKGEAARIQSVRDHIDTELFESTAKLPHRCSDDDWRLATCSERVLMAINEWEAISPAIERLKWLRQDMGYDEGTKLESTPGLALSRICCLRQWMADRDDRIAELTKQLSQSPAPAEASEGSKRTVSEAFRAAAEIEAAPAPAAESGKWNQVSQINGMYHINCGLGVPLQEAAAAADWLNARAEVEAQLSKYKRDAEAWEAVRKHGLSVNRGLFGGKRYQARREASAFDDSRLAYSDPADAVLALASQLEPTAQKEGT